jgi:hypothetical protein
MRSPVSSYQIEDKEAWIKNLHFVKCFGFGNKNTRIFGLLLTVNMFNDIVSLDRTC